MKKTEIIAAVFSMILFVTASAFGAGGNTILGKTDKTEGWLEKAGISLETAYKGEFWTNLRGGFTQAQTHLHQVDFTASLNTKKAGLWDNGRLFINLLSNQGGKLLTEQIVGDCQTVSNIEAPPATRLYQLWYEHLLFDENLSLLFGIHDLNSEFAVTEHGALFINSSFGISKDISGGARPGIFPLASPAVRAKYIPNRSWEFLVGLYHGNPGDPRIQRRLPRFALYGQAGVLINVETAYRFSHDSLPGTIKAGFWKNTGTFEDILEVDQTGIPRSRNGNKGLYLVADKMLLAREQDRGWEHFCSSDGRPTRISTSIIPMSVQGSDSWE